jgi:ArsR family transcriptional regulator
MLFEHPLERSFRSSILDWSFGIGKREVGGNSASQAGWGIEGWPSVALAADVHSLVEPGRQRMPFGMPAVIQLSYLGDKHPQFQIYGYMDKTTALLALAALGQDTRLEVFRLLVRTGAGGLPAGEIASRLDTVQNTMSAHLKVLDHAGLVRAEREGRSIRYVADMTGFRDLLAYLMEDCCNGAPELCQPVIQAVTCNC